MQAEPTILIVDDNTATRYAMRRVMERQGWRVLEAGTGADGLAALQSEPVDALVLDVNLPDMSGFDIVRRLRDDEATRLLPIVHVTAASIHTRDVIAGLEGGADAYLIHPVDPGVLLATLRGLLRVRQAEEALRESEARQRKIFENVAAPIAVLDANLTVQQCNAAFSALHGDKCELADHLGFGSDTAMASLREHLLRGEPWFGAVDLRVDNELREFEWRVVPYAEGLGLVFVEDVTRHRLRERQQNERLLTARSQLAEAISAREATEEKLVQSQKMDALGQLSGGIAHDFNNLLTSIIASLELLTDSALKGDAGAIATFAKTAMNSARRAAALTHRLLAFARRQPLDSRAVDINARITSLEELLRRTIGEQIALDVALDPAAAIATVDANQLENTILNLVVNARDALPGGGNIRIGTRVSETAPGFVELFVQDDGIGIPGELLEQVFEPFFTTKPIGQGTGLGLSMTYGFARQSGGDARIASTPGVGTTVSLLLPMGDVDNIEPTSVPSGRVLPVAGQGEAVLIVDDADDVRELTALLLTMAGYHTLQAANGDDALAILASGQRVDLLLTDIGLPGMDGRELSRAARAAHPDLPVLFLTGYAADPDTIGQFLGPRMDLMTKPYGAEALLGRIAQMVGATSAATAVS